MLRTIRLSLVAAALTTGLAACSEDAPLMPELDRRDAAMSAVPPSAQEAKAIATIRAATAKYHDLDAALADGFVLLHPCEIRPGEGPVGIVYVHFSRLLDGIADPESPDALVYEPSANGRPKLVGAEFAIPFALWTDPTPPAFFGAQFQPEAEFGVWGLHIWAWRHNPEGMYAEANPNVSCDAV